MICCCKQVGERADTDSAVLTNKKKQTIFSVADKVMLSDNEKKGQTTDK